MIIKSEGNIGRIQVSDKIGLDIIIMKDDDGKPKPLTVLGQGVDQIGPLLGLFQSANNGFDGNIEDYVTMVVESAKDIGYKPIFIPSHKLYK